MTFSLLSFTVLAGGLLIGLIPTVVDGIKKPLLTRLELPEGKLDWFVWAFYLTWLPAMPLAGLLLDSWDLSRELLFFGLVGVIVGFAWMALSRSVPLLVGSAVFLGAAYSCVTTTSVRLMTTVFFYDPADPTRVEHLHIASLNVGFIAVGTGALLGPWLATAIDRWSGSRQGLLYLSILCIGPAALTAFCERGSFPEPHESLAGSSEIFTPHMILIVGVILVYFALENCLEFWPELYLRDLGYERRGIDVAMLGFWLAFIGMRAAAAAYLYNYPNQGMAVTVGLLIFSAIILGNLTSGYEVGGGTLGFLLAGASYGPLLPGFLGIALDLSGNGKPLPATVLGALLALSGLDTLVVRPLMSGFGKDRAARSVMRVPTVLAIVLAAPLVLLAFL